MASSKSTTSVKSQRQISDFDWDRVNQLEAQGFWQQAIDCYNEGHASGISWCRLMERRANAVNRKHWSPLLDTLDEDN